MNRIECATSCFIVLCCVTRFAESYSVYLAVLRILICSVALPVLLLEPHCVVFATLYRIV